HDALPISEGPGLLFIVLPAVFAQLPFGTFFLFTFLILFLFATLTSAFSMLEIIVASVTKGDRMKRKKVSWLTGLGIFIVGIPAALSYGALEEFTMFNLTMFVLSDFLVSNIILPVVAVCIYIVFFFK